ncbi:MAG TPA: FdhF/YdeP family oxidoreductase [Thermoanaerobaculia bacterium]|nr:FdhF/YdeP family oxidoreductase [Thermoanaerobaculia bacterium]
MAAPRVSAGGGLAAINYVFRKGREVGLFELYRRLRSRNACKTCALGMGGQRGGMVNEAGHFPEVCKKSVQAQAGDMGEAITEDLIRTTSFEELGRKSPAELERLGRIAFPMIAEPGDTHFRPISWNEAYETMAGAFREADPHEVFFYSSGRSSNEAAFLMQIVARAWGSPNINNCSFYCHQASGVALGQVYGSGTSSIVLEDLEKADFALVAGANPASNHPRLITQLVRLRERGGKVIVVNPLKELGLVRFRVPSLWKSMLFGSRVSDIYLQPNIGGDIALFKALLKGVIEGGGIDPDFVKQSTSGWDEVKRDVEATSWDELVRASGVSRPDIDRTVAAILGARRGIFLWAMGLTHHVHGVDNILALANLALARGWLGRPGCGLLPIRGHSNVQGVGSMGVAPELKEAFAKRLDELYGITVTSGGLDTFGSMVAAHEGKIRAAFLLGGNLFSSNPDREWAAGALRKIPFTLYVSTKLNEGHIHGRGETSLVLPPLARDEEAQATTQESMFNFVRMSDGGVPAVRGDMRSEVEIIASFAERVLPPGRFDWTALRSHKRLREEIARAVPGFEPVARIETAGEFQIPGRTFHAAAFNTPDGKARFHVIPLPPAPEKSEFLLMTIRSEGQFNTVVYEEEDLYRGNRRRDVVMMSKGDAGGLGVREGDRVVVETDTGSLELRVAVTEIRDGNLAAYYPEANAIVGRRIDARSKTPAFKSVPVRVRKLA